MFPSALRDLLAEIYRWDEAWRVTAEAGMERRFIDFNSKGIICWQSVLEEALRQQKLDALVTVVKRDFPARSSELDTLARPPAVTAFVASEGDVARLLEASSALLKWPQVLPTGDWINRPEQEALEGLLATASGPCICLLGPPGSGKSALLAREGQRLANTGTVLLAIKADQLPRHVSSIGDLERSLNLPSPVIPLLVALSKQRPVVVLFDQLDALCDLVDLQTKRLDVMLEMIRLLAGVENLRVVVSCRAFEFDHDLRLRGFDRQEIALKLPTWASVEAILAARQISTDGWPTAFREVLRTPQHLSIFLRYLIGVSLPPITSYQSLLQVVWEREVLDASRLPGRQHLIADLARLMATEETLWVSPARFDSQATELAQLEAAGILRRSEDRLRIGFSHQSMFEFALARTFSHPGRLSDYVLAKQGALFVRSTLWSSLTYLRVAEPSTYGAEFSKLWSTDNLRDHVRFLLIDFIGHQAEPSDSEQRAIFDALGRPSFQQRALAVTAGSESWFRRLSKTLLPGVMSSDVATAWKAVPTLIAATRFARDSVLDLIERYWTNEPARLPLAWAVLLQATRWDERGLNDVLKILSTVPQGSVDVMAMISTIAADQPTLAAQLFASAFSKRLAGARQEVVPRSPPPPASDEIAFMRWQLNDEHRQPFEKILGDTWYGLDELGTRAPLTILQLAWPTFIEVVDALTAHYRAPIARYRESYSFSLGSRRHDRDAADVPATMEAAIEALAKDNATEFLAFLGRWKHLDLLPIHKLLAVGLEAVAEQHSANVIDYLVGDPRRLNLGDWDNPDVSAGLVASVSRQATDDDLKRLIDAIESWRLVPTTDPNEGAKNRLQRLRSERVTRFLLLSAIPRNRRPPRIERIIQEEHRALGSYLPEPEEEESRGAVFVQSAMSTSQMERADDDEILRFFAELPDSTEWHHPTRSLVGGSIEASREFAELATKQPDRVASLVFRFDPNTHQRPVAYALEKLAEVQTASAIFAIVKRLDAAGFDSHEFRTHAARGLARLAKTNRGLPEDVCELLKKWLTETPPPKIPTSEVDDDKDDGRPMLWGLGGFVTIPEGTFPFLDALILGYLYRDPPDEANVLVTLEQHLTRPENPVVWKILSHYFPFLARQSPVVLTAFLDRLFDAVPDVLNSPFGIRMLAEARGVLPGDLAEKWMDSLRRGAWSRGPQAFGEIVFLYSSRNDRTWFKDQVEDLLRGAAEGLKPERQLLGTTHTAARLWNQPRYRQLATNTLIAAIAYANDQTFADAVIGAFHSDDLLFDREMERLLTALATAPAALFKARNLFILIEKLRELVAVYPKAVAAVCMAFVAERPTADSEVFGVYSSAGDLADIALTLQRLEETRSEGTALFERLFAMNIYGLDDVLPENEQRARRATNTSPRRRLQRRRDRNE